MDGGLVRINETATAGGSIKMAAPSVPEPPPIKSGVEVTPLLIEWLSSQTADSSPIIALIEARRLYGLSKYGQSLMTEDGRDTMEDARQEAADLLQYIYKAKLQGAPIPRNELVLISSILDCCKRLIDDL